MRRTREVIQAELTQTRERLALYLKREADMLDKNLRARIRELEAELAGGSARRALGVVPHDW